MKAIIKYAQDDTQINMQQLLHRRLEAFLNPSSPEGKMYLNSGISTGVNQDLILQIVNDAQAKIEMFQRLILDKDNTYIQERAVELEKLIETAKKGYVEKLKICFLRIFQKYCENTQKC